MSNTSRPGRLTVDQNLPFQQNLNASGVAVVVAMASTNRLKELRALVPEILNALALVRAGEVMTVGSGSRQS